MCSYHKMAFKCNLFSQLALQDQFVTGIVAVCILVLLPYIHLGLAYGVWAEDQRPVDKHTCSCSCWDGLFKGSYEYGLAGYKHVYFNLTSNTFKILALTIAAVIVTYECVKHILKLYLISKLRYSMLALFLTAIYPHYYSWWMFFNYCNDNYYEQWNHQVFFTLTELLSTAVVVFLCDSQTAVHPRCLLWISSIGLLHILASSFDQFVENVFYQRGHLYQITRDIGFMIPDLFHLIMPLLLMRRQSTQHTYWMVDGLSRRDYMCAGMMVVVMLAISIHL